ncbi:MAG: hypothetical protein ABF242_10715 [Flavobacteriales bacterium]
MLLIFIVIGLAGGILTSLFYALLIMFFPDKKVKTRDVLIIMATVLILVFSYLIYMISN